MQNRKLPVLAAFTHAARSVRQNLPFAISISWPIYAVLIPLLAVGNFLLYHVAEGAGGSETVAWIIAFVLMLANLIGFAIIAVCWHRYILRDDVGTRPSMLKVGTEAWAYAGNIVLIALIAFACIVVVALVSELMLGGASDFSPGVMTLIVIAAAAIGLLVTRLSVKFPAIALGRKDFSFKEAWHATEGNAWELLGLMMLNSTLVIGAGLCVAAIAAAFSLLHPSLGMIVQFVLQLGVDWILVLFSSSVLTSLYGFFVEKREF